MFTTFSPVLHNDFRDSLILEGGMMMDGTVMKHIQDSKIHKSTGAASSKENLCSFSWEGLTAVEQWKDRCRKIVTDIEKQRHGGVT